MKTTRILLLSLLVLLLGLAGWGQSPANSDPFVQAALKREAATKVVDITFKMKEIRPTGSSVPGAGLVPDAAPSGSTLPSDVVLESTNRLVIQGTMVRYEGHHPMWNVNSGKALPQDVLSVSSKGQPKIFYPNGEGTDPTPSGIISRDSMNFYVRMAHLQPLTVAYRGTKRLLTSYPVASLKRTGIKQFIDGRECWEYAQIERETRMSYFVDPERDYNVSRIVWTNGKHLEYQTDIVYTKNPVCGWIPTSWVEHAYEYLPGKLSRRAEVQVVSTKFNEELPKDQFDVVFPPGTEVYDQRDKEYYRVQPDGRLRRFSLFDEELSTREVRMDMPWYRHYLWWLVSGGVGILLLLFAWMWRKRRVVST